MKPLNIVFVSMACGFALIATGQARERLPFEKLTATEQKSVETCNQLLKKIAETHLRQDRETLARLLVESAKSLNELEPNFFRGWVWRAQAALVLGAKADALKALENLVELGVAQNKDPRVLGVVYAIEKRGWLAPDSGDAPNDSNRSAAAAQSSGSTTHIVVKGETLGSIAQHHNITLAELEKANKTVNPRRLQIGQTLVVPATKSPDSSSAKKN